MRAILLEIIGNYQIPRGAKVSPAPLSDAHALRKFLTKIKLCKQNIHALGFGYDDEALTFRFDTVRRRGWNKSLTQLVSNVKLRP